MTALAEFLNRVIPNHYRLDGNVPFWNRFDELTLAATGPTDFDELQLLAADEFRSAESARIVMDAALSLDHTGE